MTEQQEGKTAKAASATPNQPQAPELSRDASRELDALIAEQVMGWRCIGEGQYGRLIGKTAQGAFGEYGALRDVPHYSTDIAAAWLVVREMERRKFSCAIGVNAYAGGHQNGVKFFKAIHGLGWPIFDGEPHPGHYAVEDSIPLAICKAALGTMGML
jgi:hypothetical protein